MAYTNAEHQARFKARMYEAGFKQSFVWVRRKEGKRGVITNMSAFIKEMKRLTFGMDKTDLPDLFTLLLKVTEAKKEAAKQRKK